VAVRRFETAPGKQAQVDWGHLAREVQKHRVPDKLEVTVRDQGRGLDLGNFRAPKGLVFEAWDSARVYWAEDLTFTPSLKRHHSHGFRAG
jgi:hypothetical protein